MKKERDRTIDIMKVLLVIGMILAHCIQLIGQPMFITNVLSILINLITFSGFLFCFGYAVSIAYLDKDKGIVTKKIIKNAIEILIAFYISGISYEIFMVKELGLEKLIKIFTLSNIPGYSEFLAGFFVLNILTVIFLNQIKRLLESNVVFIVILVITLISTFIPYEQINIPQLGLIVGTSTFACFPLLQYFGYYLLGMYFQRNVIKFNMRYFILASLCTCVFIGYIFIYEQIPSRFPPSLYWILGGVGFIYLYYLVSCLLANKISKNSRIYFIGENTLYFLLGSNLILFIMSGIFNIKLSFIVNILVSVLIISLCYVSVYVVKKNFKKKNYINLITKQLKV